MKSAMPIYRITEIRKGHMFSFYLKGISVAVAGLVSFVLRRNISYLFT